MAGHLFITRGDVLQLACDAVLVPSGTHNGRPGHVTAAWRDALAGRLDATHLRRPPTDAEPVVLVADGDGIQRPALYAGFSGDTGHEAHGFYTRVAVGFIEAAAAIRPPRAAPRPLMDRRPFVAMPLIGGGEGGQGKTKGALLLALVESIVAAARRFDVDVALVLSSDADYAAAQQARHRATRPWEGLDPRLRKAALPLAERARESQLVVFLGAGASMGAGLPSWKELLRTLAERSKLSVRKRRALKELEPRDAAGILKHELDDLPAEIRRITAVERGSIGHQLVASMPVREVVTTNYDLLFDRAWKAAGVDATVLPGRRRLHPGKPWLLKLHGSVDGHGRIVLARDDYLRFEGEGVALAGLVQAMLLTRHMLFVGYSLSDDNFHRLVHQARSAMDPGSADPRFEEPFGTAITPRAPSLQDDLWRDQVRFISTAGRGTDNDPRRAAILLDHIGALAARPAAHILDDTYAALLTREQHELRRRLTELQRLVDAEQLDEPTQHAVIDALARLR